MKSGSGAGSAGVFSYLVRVFCFVWEGGAAVGENDEGNAADNNFKTISADLKVYFFIFAIQIYVAVTSIGTFTFLSMSKFSFSNPITLLSLSFFSITVSCFLAYEFLFSIIKPYVKCV